MTSCEKCWRDGDGDPHRYHQFLKANNCTPEEQAGITASICPGCKRRTVHIYVKKCMNPECNENH